MDWKLEFSKRQSSVPEAHIQILRRGDDLVHTSQMNEASLRRPSLAQEAREGNVARSSVVTNPDSISNMEKGTTFAARARAAELYSVRAAAAARRDALANDEVGDEVPDIVPVSLGSLKFTLPKKKDGAKAIRSANPLLNSARSSEESHAVNLRDFSTQSATLGRRDSALDQQSIRQKVREVSARQQSYHQTSEEEKLPHVLPNSASVSPYSSSESRIGQVHVAKKAELNTQHIREVRREAEKQRDLVESRSQQHYSPVVNDVLDENRPIGRQELPRHLLPKLNECDTDMSFRSSRRPDGLPTSYTSPQSDYGSAGQASLHLAGSPTHPERHQSHTNLPFHPRPPIMMSPMNPQSHSSPGDPTKASPTDLSTQSGNITPAHLRATSPAFVPSNVGLGINMDRGQIRTSLPSVKGTERGQHQHGRHHSQMPNLPPGLSEHSRGQFNPTTTSSSSHLSEMQDTAKLAEAAIHARKKAKAATTTGTGTTNVRDPMPYTGFSKRDQLYQNLQKTIDESTAKGELPASKRSVLHDPVASKHADRPNYNFISNGGSSNTMTSANMVSRGQDAEVPPSISSRYPSSRAGLDYDPDSLKESDPLPSFIAPKPVETKSLSSPQEGYGYRGRPSQYSAAPPYFPPGLSHTSNTFQEAEMSNESGFWNDSLAMDSGRPLIEESVKRLASQTPQNEFQQRSRQETGTNHTSLRGGGAWVEEQELLLRPKSSRRNVKELDEEASRWFDSGKTGLEERVKSTLQRAEGISPFAPGAQYWETPALGHARKLPGSHHAPIGSERPHSSNGNQEDQKRVAIDVMANVLANLASYHGGENPGPTQRYSQPPAWCIDHTEAGRKSFLNDNWGDVPKRVGRDPRYQKTVHEGRTTYFEDPIPASHRGLTGTYKPTAGWGNSR